MIQTRLQVYLPQFQKRRIRRYLLNIQKKTQRLIRSNIKKAQRKTLAAARRQYYLTSALADVRMAAGRNEDIIISTLLITFIFCLGISVSIANFTLQFMVAAVELAAITGITPMALFAVAMGILVLATVCPAAFLLNMNAVAVLEGANRKRYRSVRATVRRSLRQAGRVTASWAVFWTILILPLLLAAAGAFVWLQSHHISPEHVPYYLIGATAVVAAWVIGVITSYSLAPHVALFEPQLPLLSAFEKSRRLVVRRGRMFILSLYGVTGVLLFGIYKLAAAIEQLTHIPAGAIFAVLALAAVLLINAILVILYRKRRLARTR